MTDRRSFRDLVELVARLRGATGCPWDREQDHHSLRPYVVEEAFELVSAIDAEDSQAILEECGDLLLQVLLHSQIEAEQGHGSIEDVVTGIHDKLVRRHPHVFGDASNDIPSIKARWEDLKAEEGGRSHQLSALVRARKLAERSPDLVLSECGEESVEERHGRRLLQAIADAVAAGVDPEIALRRAIEALDADSRAED
ncbi:MAG: nucleoside triphosphate hydrolase [Candidatus Bipolaricaulota bacterium]|nr:MAG: nucleoside triphosphate hydrolase [Candidatus Bipolaricaulota bacterium]